MNWFPLIFYYGKSIFFFFNENKTERNRCHSDTFLESNVNDTLQRGCFDSKIGVVVNDIVCKLIYGDTGKRQVVIIIVIYTKIGVRLIEITPRASIVGEKAYDF